MRLQPVSWSSDEASHVLAKLWLFIVVFIELKQMIHLLRKAHLIAGHINGPASHHGKILCFLADCFSGYFVSIAYDRSSQ
ncbi:hypothetical protein [Okeania hirsuta]|uniref:hypothetical protein n=1 Tax=Okeania hirsuta TaxID=1458930 RepID=UPI000F542947|nr:hypothetical protein [Okeania hirsuta]